MIQSVTFFDTPFLESSDSQILNQNVIFLWEAEFRALALGLLLLPDLPLLVDLEQLPLQVVHGERVLADLVVYLQDLAVQVVELITTDVGCEVRVGLLLLLKGLSPRTFSLFFPCLLLGLVDCGEVL